MTPDDDDDELKDTFWQLMGRPTDPKRYNKEGYDDDEDNNDDEEEDDDDEEDNGDQHEEEDEENSETDGASDNCSEQ